MPSIDRNDSAPFYLQVYTQIAEGIESGLYPAGKKLPSIRECARELGVSNTTIELAYQKLTAEGYVQARRGSGYTICALDEAPASPVKLFSSEYQSALAELMAPSGDGSKLDDAAYDFAYDTIDKSLFPFAAWARISREVFFAPGAENACLYNSRQGLRQLREQIAHYVASEYGLNCVAEQVLIMPTTRDLISAILSLFDPAHDAFAMEDPGYNEVRKIVRQSGFAVQSIPVSPFPEWDSARRYIDGAKIVFTTPSCQFPTNQPMPLDLKQHLISWAEEHDAYLIDDEYGWEFQSGIARTPTLAALDKTGRVITIGTFSNCFTPAICLSYAILPPQLMLRWRRIAGKAHPGSPWQTQAGMAMFMADDHWRTHIRKMRTAMLRKRRAALEALEKYMGDSVEALIGPCSLFILMQTRDDRSESELIEAAERAGVRVYPTSPYWSEKPPETWRYVLVGYAGIAEEAIAPGILTLARAWGIRE